MVAGRGLSEGGRKGAKLLSIAIQPEVVWGTQEGDLLEKLLRCF